MRSGYTSEIDSGLVRLFEPWNRSDAPGLAVGVALRGEPIFRRAFGLANIEHGVALSTRSRLRIGSTTKHFLALLALLMQERGQFDIDAPIEKYLPEVKGPPGALSVRSLLKHRGGSRCFLDIGFIAHGMASMPPGRALAIQARQSGKNFSEGEAVIYNNGGYHLVSLALERVGNAPLCQLMEEILFRPLGLMDTALEPSDFNVSPDAASLYVQTPACTWRKGLFPTEEMLGEGGIMSTVNDMLRWMSHLRTQHLFGRPESWAELVEITPLKDQSHSPYALGLMVDTYRGARILHHSGAVIGGASQMLTFPDHGLDIIVLSNGAPKAKPTELAERIADLILRDDLGSPAACVRTSDNPHLLGEWSSRDAGLVLEFKNFDGDLRLSICESAGIPLRPHASGSVASAGSVSDIILHHIHLPPDELEVRFAGRIHKYARVQPAAHTSFDTRISGRYWSEDGDCFARISRSDQDWRIQFGDQCGQWSLALRRVSEYMAVASAPLIKPLFGIALTFDPGTGPTSGFTACTTRTRHLRFERKD